MMRSLLSRENFVVRAGIVIAGLGGCAVYTASGTIAEAAGVHRRAVSWTEFIEYRHH